MHVPYRRSEKSTQTPGLRYEVLKAGSGFAGMFRVWGLGFRDWGLGFRD